MEPIKIDMSHTIFSMVDNNGRTSINWNYELLSKESRAQLYQIQQLYPESYFVWFNDTRSKLKPKNKRTCRFCGKSYPDVKFSTVAHTFPESLGNKHNISDIECDECNRKFSVYENDFNNFIGPLRALMELPNKKGFAKFKSRNKGLTIEQVVKGAVDLHLAHADTKNHIKYSTNNEFIRIQTEGDPYIPINVYRCLLKTAVTLIDQADLANLSETIAFLNDEYHRINPTNDFIVSMNQYFIPGNFNVPPFMVYFKKKTALSYVHAPTYIFVLYLRNLILQFFIPFHRYDFHLFNPTGKRLLYKVPPLINELWFKKYGGPFGRFYCLNDNEINKINIQYVDWKLMDNANNNG
jgi:hypothetical protein